MSYTTNEFTVDEVGFIQIAETRVLAAVARGELDLNRWPEKNLPHAASMTRAVGSDSSAPNKSTISNHQEIIMTAKIQLTPAQHAILAYAHNHGDGKIIWFPDNIKGGARKKVLEGLFNRALITHMNDDWFITTEAYDAMGVPRKAPASAKAIDDIIESAKPRTRTNSKQAEVVAMLRRPEGATITQIMDTTGWQQHTVRGTFAGAFKKKLGLAITSEKSEGGERVYKIAG